MALTTIDVCVLVTNKQVCLDVLIYIVSYGALVLGTRHLVMQDVV